MSLPSPIRQCPRPLPTGTPEHYPDIVPQQSYCMTLAFHPWGGLTGLDFSRSRATCNADLIPPDTRFLQQHPLPSASGDTANRLYSITPPLPQWAKLKTGECLNIPPVIAPTSPITLTRLMCGIPIPLPMISLNCYPGYHTQAQSNGITTSKSASWTMWGNGSCKLKNLETVITGAGKVMLSCFALGIPWSERHLSGNENYHPGRERSQR